MIVAITITLPLFCLILAGYIAAKRELITVPGIAGLNGFVFYFGLPLILFFDMATAPCFSSLPDEIARYALGCCNRVWPFSTSRATAQYRTQHMLE